jgi:hypothetical protein
MVEISTNENTTVMPWKWKRENNLIFTGCLLWNGHTKSIFTYAMPFKTYPLPSKHYKSPTVRMRNWG